MSVLASLKILLGLDSAQITTDLGKARGAVAAGMGEIQSRTAAAMAAVGSEIEGLGGHLRGAQQATGAAMKGLELMGMKGSAAVGAIGNAVSGLLAGGFTPLGLALGAVTAGIALFAETEREAAAAADETAIAISKNVDRLKELKAVRELIRQGKDGTREELQVLEAEEKLAGLREKLFLASAGRSLVQRPTDEMVDLRKQIADAERDLGVQREALDLARENAEARRAGASAAKSEAVAVTQIVKAASSGGDPLAAVRRRTEELRASISATSLRMDSARWGVPAEILAQRERVREAESAVGSSLANSTRRRGLTDEQALLLRRVDLERRYLDLLETEARLAKEAQQRAASSAAKAGGVTPAKRGDDQRIKETEQFNARAIELKEELAFDLAQLDRDETERAVEAERERWKTILSDARLNAETRIEIEELLAERIKRIREAGNKKGSDPESKTTQPKTFTDGFKDTIGNVRGVMNLQADLGVEAAHGLEGAFDTAFEAITRGTEDAGAALKQFAAEFLLDLGQMILKATLFKAIMSVIGGGTGAAPADASGAAVPATAGAAHGGLFRVGGMGGLDSKIVALRASPGELVRVSNGANSGGARGGGFSGTLIVQPPAVLADEVERKMRPDAKARIVATATSRPGRRGSRARWD